MEYQTLQSLSNKAVVLTIVITVLHGLSLGMAYTCRIGTTNTSTDGNVLHNTTSQIYLNLNQPAPCSGVITALHFCYHVANGGGGQTQSALIQVWREESNNTFKAINEYVLIVELVQRNNMLSTDPVDIFCQNKILNESEHIAVLAGDVLGVFYAESTTTTPLQVIFSTTTQNETSEIESGVYFVDESTSVEKVQKGSVIDALQLKSNSSLVLHLSAEIDQREPSVTAMPTTTTEMFTSGVTHPLPAHTTHTNLVVMSTALEASTRHSNTMSIPIFISSDVLQSTLDIEPSLMASATMFKLQSVSSTLQMSVSSASPLVSDSESVSSIFTLVDTSPTIEFTITPTSILSSVKTKLISTGVTSFLIQTQTSPLLSLPVTESTAMGLSSFLTQTHTLTLPSLRVTESTDMGLPSVKPKTTMIGQSTLLVYSTVNTPSLSTLVPLLLTTTTTPITESGSVSLVTRSASQNSILTQTHSFRQTYSDAVTPTLPILPSLSRRQFTSTTYLNTFQDTLSVGPSTTSAVITSFVNTIQLVSTSHAFVSATPSTRLSDINQTVITTQGQSNPSSISSTFHTGGTSVSMSQSIERLSQSSSFPTQSQPVGTTSTHIVPSETLSVPLGTMTQSASLSIPEITSSVVSLHSEAPLQTQESPSISATSIGMSLNSLLVTTSNGISSTDSPIYTPSISTPILVISFRTLPFDAISDTVSSTVTTKSVSVATTNAQTSSLYIVPTETQLASPATPSLVPTHSRSMVPSPSNTVHSVQTSTLSGTQQMPTTPVTVSTVPASNSDGYITAIIVGTTIIAILVTALTGCTVITCMIIVYYKIKVSKVKTVSSSESSTPLSLSARHFSIDNPNYSGFPIDVEINHQPFTPTLNEFTNRGFKSQSEENLLSNSGVSHSRSHPNGIRVPSDYETPVVIIPNKNGLMVSPILQKKTMTPIHQSSQFDNNFPNNQRSVVTSGSPVLNLQPYKVVHLLNVSDSQSTPNQHEYDKPVNTSLNSLFPLQAHKNGTTRVSDYEVPILNPPSTQNGVKTSLELVPLCSEGFKKSTHKSECIVMESEVESLQNWRQNGRLCRHESEPRGWNQVRHREWTDLKGPSTTQHTEDLHEHNRVSSSMDGPYRRPPPKEDEIFAVLTQMGTNVIPQENIRTHISPSSIQLQTLKSEWRINKEAPWIEVDVKVISKKEETAQSVSDHIKLLQEAAIMAQFRHPNVMRLHGIVTEGDTIMLVLEHLQKGDLRKCLVQMGRSVIPPDTPKLLLNYSQQIALGMHYLSSKGFLHKDLAARNVFVTKDDNCKVGEFGKSRDLSNASHYISSGGKIPVRWTAPEAMYYQKYSTTSDIWSYGCLLYEIWSLGRMPFREFTNAEVIKKIDSGYRLPPPPGCPRAIYDVMIQCWHPKPLFRPTFKDIISILLADESRILQIPVSDASTHESAIILGASLDAGKYMYTDLQRRYQQARRPLTVSQSTSVGENKKHSDYDHISGQKYVMSFPTSSKDIEYMYKGPLSTTASVPPKLSPTSKTRNGHAHASPKGTDSDFNSVSNRHGEIPVYLEPEVTTANGHVTSGCVSQNGGALGHSVDHPRQQGQLKSEDDAGDYEDIEAY